MVGDIDFIFSKEDYPKAITILREFGYSELNKYKILFSCIEDITEDFKKRIILQL